MADKTETAERLAKASDNYIKEMYRSVKKAFENDSELTKEEKQRFQIYHDEGVYYGTDIFSDWTEWKGMLEFEVQRRKLKV